MSEATLTDVEQARQDFATLINHRVRCLVCKKVVHTKGRDRRRLCSHNNATGKRCSGGGDSAEYVWGQWKALANGWAQS